MIQYSIVVPFAASIIDFEATLASALRYRNAQCQVVAVHTSDYDDPHGLVPANEIKLVDAVSPDIGSFWSAALNVCVGKFIVWLYPGTELRGDAWSLIEDAFSDPDVASATPYVFNHEHWPSDPAAGVSIDDRGTGISVRVRRHTQQPIGRILGPTHLAGAYRQEALGWLELTEVFHNENFWDVELGCALQALGYRTVAIPNWQVDSRRLHACNQRFRRAHGAFANRIVRRFGAGIPSLWRQIAADISRSCVVPWRLKHAFQRLQGTRHRDEDDAFHAEMVRLSAMRRSLTAKRQIWQTPLPTQRTEPSQRRAA